ncbi:MAG: shikimate dehydrogenase, partial [Candidatus Diapherotrites archaeon]|nr:shikimate dehydrogenase [Candidatus Diapherotrites archaeon]
MQINSETKVLAVIGNPVGHSMSPAMQNAGLQRLGLNFVYLAFDVKNLKAALGAMRDLGFKGYSVTIPHKEKIIQYLDRVDPLAAKIRAVNTVVNSNGMLVGYNTDAGAAAKALLEKTALDGKRALMVGAGGVARAIAFALQQNNAVITVCDAMPLKAKSLAQAVGGKHVRLCELAAVDADILVNATPVGM